MAWASKKLYAILMSSEEGKDILEGLGEKSQDEFDKEVEAFFGKGGKGASQNADYKKAKDEDYDEDYERSWGPKNDDEDDEDDDLKSKKNDENIEEENQTVKKEKEKLILGKKNKDGYKLTLLPSGDYSIRFPDGMYMGAKSIEEAQKIVDEDDSDYSWIEKTKEKRKQVKEALKREGWHKERNSKGYNDNLMSFGDEYGENFISWEDDEEGCIAYFQNEDGSEDEKEFKTFEEAQNWIEKKKHKE